MEGNTTNSEGIRRCQCSRITQILSYSFLFPRADHYIARFWTKLCYSSNMPYLLGVVCPFKLLCRHNTMVRLNIFDNIQYIEYKDIVFATRCLINRRLSISGDKLFSLCSNTLYHKSSRVQKISPK